MGGYPQMLDRERLLDLIERWKEAKRQGQLVSASELCAECPEHADELERMIGKLRRVWEMLPTKVPPAQSPTDQGLPPAPERIGPYRVEQLVDWGSYGA